MELDTEKVKRGNGIDDWVTLPYWNAGLAPVNVSISGNISGVPALVSSGTVYFAGGNNITLSQNGNSITISGPNALTNSALFRATSNDSQLRFTSADSQLQFTSGNSAFQRSSQMTDYQLVANSSLSLGTAATQSFQYTSQMTDYLGTGYTSHTHSQYLNTSQSSLFRQTSVDSQLRFTSADSQLQFTSGMINYLGTTYTSHTHSQYVNTSATSAYQLIANSTLSLGTGATTSFRHTSADTQLRFTSADSQLRFTSADTQLQFTSANTKFIQSWELKGNTSGTTGSAQGSVIYLQGGNNITLSGSSNTIVISAPAAIGQSQQPMYYSASGSSSSNSTLQFGNSNGVSFSLSNGSVVATVKTDYQSSGNYLTTAAQSTQTNAISLGGNSGTTGSSVISAGGYVLAGGNNITLSMSNNSLSIHGGGGAANINISAGTTSNNLTALTFSNASGVSFGLNGSVLTATVKTDYQTSGNYLTTAMQSNAATISNINVSAGTTSNNLSAITFSNSNGVSFGLNGSVVTATVATNYQSQGAYLTTAAQSTQTLAFSLSGNSATTGSSNITAGGYALAGGNGVTLQQSNNTISFSVATNYQSQAAYLTTQSGQGYSAGNGSNTFQTLSFADSNGVSFSTGTQGIFATVKTDYQSSGNYLTTAALSNHSHGNPTLALTNLTGTTASASNGFTLSLSAAAPGGGGSINISAGTTSNNLTNFVLSNSNNFSFGLNGSTLTASYAESNQTLGLYGLGNTTQNSSTTLDARTLSYNGLGAMSVGFSNGSIQLSAPGTSSLSATGAVSISVNGSTISIGAPQMATLSRFEYPDEAFTALSTIGQGSLSFNRVFIPFNVTGSAAQVIGSISASAAASTGTQNISLWMGIYKLNGSNLSLASSGSANNSFQVSSNTALSSNYIGVRQLTVPMNLNITPGVYWIGAVMSTGTVGTACNLVLNLYGNSLVLSSGTGGAALIGAGTAAGRSPFMMQGVYTAATSVGPSAVATNDINMTSAGNQMRANFYIQLYNATY